MEDGWLIWSILPNYVSFDGYFYDNDFPNMSNVVWAGSDLTVDLSSPIYFIPALSEQPRPSTLQKYGPSGLWHFQMVQGRTPSPAEIGWFIFYCIVQSVQIPIYFTRFFISNIK